MIRLHDAERGTLIGTITEAQLRVAAWSSAS